MIPPTRHTLKYSCAFQPIVDIRNSKVLSYEALVRGPKNESAASVLGAITEGNRYELDQLFRLNAISMASQLGIECCLNLNLMSGSLEASDCPITTTLMSAKDHHLRAEQIVLEFTETEIAADLVQFTENVNRYRSFGVKVAIDDFGAGYSGLNLLAEFQPDLIKLDMSLIRSIDSRGPRQAIVRGICCTCNDLGIEIIAEGVESVAEYGWCVDEGIELFQGYLFARPGFEHLPMAFYPRTD